MVLIGKPSYVERAKKLLESYQPANEKEEKIVKLLKIHVEYLESWNLYDYMRLLLAAASEPGITDKLRKLLKDLVPTEEEIKEILKSDLAFA